MARVLTSSSREKVTINAATEALLKYVTESQINFSHQMISGDCCVSSPTTTATSQLFNRKYRVVNPRKRKKES